MTSTSTVSCLHTITSCPPFNLSTSPTSYTHTHSSALQSLMSLIPITAVLWQTSLVLLHYSQPPFVSPSHTHTHTHEYTSTPSVSLHRPIVRLPDSEWELWHSVSTNKAWLHSQPPDNRRTSSALWKCDRQSLVLDSGTFLLPLMVQWTSYFPFLITANTLFYYVHQKLLLSLLIPESLLSHVHVRTVPQGLDLSPSEKKHILTRAPANHHLIIKKSACDFLDQYIYCSVCKMVQIVHHMFPEANVTPSNVLFCLIQ